MNVFYRLGLLYLADAILNFIGIVNVPKIFENQPWKREYVIKDGIIYLIFSIIYLILYKVTPPIRFSFWIELFFGILLIMLESVFKYFILDRKYKKRLDEQGDKDSL